MAFAGEPDAGVVSTLTGNVTDVGAVAAGGGAAAFGAVTAHACASAVGGVYVAGGLSGAAPSAAVWRVDAL